RRDTPPRLRAGSTGAQLLLVEHALVEAWREADVIDVALLEVDATAQLAARDDALLADDALEQVGRLDGQGAAGAGHVEVRADVAPQVRQAERAGAPGIGADAGHVAARAEAAADHAESPLGWAAGLARRVRLRHGRLGRRGRGHARNRAQSEGWTPGGAGAATRLGTSWLQRLPHSNGGSGHRTDLQRTPGMPSGMRR